ncbi:hypothetical protein ACSSV4_003576 [Roseovarius sp. MBR-154]|jgi:hypothetical protein
MTFRTLAFATALTSVSALAAYAQGEGGTEHQLTDDNGIESIQDSDNTTQSGNAANPEQHDDEKGIDTVEGDPAEADVALPMIDPEVDPQAEAPSQTDLMTKELSNAEQTLIENVLAEAERGSTVSTSDDYVIGKVTGTLGQEGADHLVYVEVNEDADIPAQILGFRASALSVEEVGDLEYAMSLETLRKNVAERVAAQTQ